MGWRRRRRARETGSGGGVRAFLAARVAIGLHFVVACGSTSAPSPFAHADQDGGGPDSAVPSFDGQVPPLSLDPDSGVGAPGEWGGACVDDGECDDKIDCTTDTCDKGRGRCHFEASGASCDDGAFCNGVEQCVLGIGCRPGDPVTCSDGTACTIDACDEPTHRCVHSPRDADSDGDPDGNCPGGGDCNDRNPDVSSLHAEICGNGIDDNCDGRIDEKGCSQPSYDVCADPLDVTGSGAFPLSSASAKQDYSASCLAKAGTFKDLVVALHVPDGAPTDVDVAVTTTSGNVALATASRCGDASSELACALGVVTPTGAYASRLVLRGLTKGVYPLYVFAAGGGALVLDVELSPATAAPSNETCGTAVPITDGGSVVAHLPGASADLTTACGKPVGDLVYDFTLDAPRDVRLFATTSDQYGTPMVSLLRDPCSSAHAEITCRTGQNSELFERALPAGHYFVSVSSTGPSDVTVALETAAPTTPPADESCASAPALAPNRAIDVSLADHVDDIQLGCSVGTPDAAYALTLAGPSDVLLVELVSDGDTGAVSLADRTCSENQLLLACGSSDATPIRAIARDVPAGEYRVVVESELGSPVGISALVRPSSPPLLVPFADGCADAQAIPSTGGLFEGNTANSSDDFTASCDVGGTSGAPDQLLSMHLDVESRLVLDARGSDYAVILDVRTGASCPGDEVSKACSAGYLRDRSFLDLDLPAGDYWVQVDGYDGASGAWTFDAFISPK